MSREQLCEVSEKKGRKDMNYAVLNMIEEYYFFPAIFSAFFSSGVPH
jgi:hypothetical protein